MALKSQPAVAKAVTWLEAWLAQHGSSVMVLPAIPRLALEAQVSGVTLWKAVQILKQKGLLRAERGGRVRPAENNDLATPLLPHAEEPYLRWQKVRAELQREIAHGEFRNVELLPTRAVLCKRYGISPNTLRKILNNLESADVIFPQGHGWSPKLPRRRLNFRGVIFLVGLGDSKDRYTVFNDRMQSFARSLERECTHANLDLELVGYSPGRRPRFLRHLQRQEALAHLVWLDEWAGFGEPEDRRIGLLHAMAKIPKPTLIFDAMGNTTHKAELQPKGVMKIYAPAAFTAGVAMGQALLQMGHQNIAWLAPSHAHYWSLSRLQGLQKAFAQAGYSKGVKVFVLNREHSQMDLALALLDWPSDRFDQIFHIRQTIDFPEMAMAHYQAIREMRLFDHVEKRRLQDARKSAEALEAAGNTGLVEAVPGFSQNIMSLISETALDFYLESIFTEALKFKEITAWVCANDATAFSAKKFLETKHVRIPQDLSLTGFDDTPLAFQTKLTSFEFGLEGLAPRMLNEALAATTHQRKRLQRMGEIPGQVIIRESLAPPSKILR